MGEALVLMPCAQLPGDDVSRSAPLARGRWSPREAEERNRPEGAPDGKHPESGKVLPSGSGRGEPGQGKERGEAPGRGRLAMRPPVPQAFFDL